MYCYFLINISGGQIKLRQTATLRNSHTHSVKNTFTFPSAHVTEHTLTERATSDFFPLCCVKYLSVYRVTGMLCGIRGGGLTLCLYLVCGRAAAAWRIHKRNGNCSHPFWQTKSLHLPTDLGPVPLCDFPLTKESDRH